VLWNGGAFAEECVCTASQAIRLPSKFLHGHRVIECSSTSAHDSRCKTALVRQPVATAASVTAYAKDTECEPVGLYVHAEGIDVAAAAGLPVAFGTAHLALTERARLQAGQVLLVLGAGGGVGVAAVQVQVCACCACCGGCRIAAGSQQRVVSCASLHACCMSAAGRQPM
jgi:NADPH:quinone reductase-like Zn-dependent oxidoreductase